MFRLLLNVIFTLFVIACRRKTSLSESELKKVIDIQNAFVKKIQLPHQNKSNFNEGDYIATKKCRVYKSSSKNKIIFKWDKIFDIGLTEYCIEDSIYLDKDWVVISKKLQRFGAGSYFYEYLRTSDGSSWEISNDALSWKMLE